MMVKSLITRMMMMIMMIIFIMVMIIDDDICDVSCDDNVDRCDRHDEDDDV